MLRYHFMNHIENNLKATKQNILPKKQIKFILTTFIKYITYFSYIKTM